jgi:hypothetical protein
MPASASVGRSSGGLFEKPARIAPIEAHGHLLFGHHFADAALGSDTNFGRVRLELFVLGLAMRPATVLGRSVMVRSQP